MKKILLIIGMVLLLTGCASTTQYVKFSDSPITQDKKVAKIYVIRPSAFASAVKMKIYENDELIGKLGARSYLLWEIDTGQGNIRIKSKGENTDMLVINPQAGKTYYIKQKIKAGMISARTKLIFLDEGEAKEILKKLKKPQMKYTE